MACFSVSPRAMHSSPPLNSLFFFQIGLSILTVRCVHSWPAVFPVAAIVMGQPPLDVTQLIEADVLGIQGIPRSRDTIATYGAVRDAGEDMGDPSRNQASLNGKTVCHS